MGMILNKEIAMKFLNKDELVANEIKLYILKNNLEEGQKLFSEREIAERTGVQRATVRSALAILEEEGIIENKERSGRYISHPRISTNLQQIKSFSEKTTDLGDELITRLLSFERIETDKKLYKKIKCPIGTPVFKITRVRNIVRDNGVLPIAIEYAYIPEMMAEKLMKYDLEERSLFDILINEYKRVPDSEDQIIEIVYADEFEAKNLNIDKMTALVRKSGLTFDKDGNVIQYINAIMKKDWVEFEQTNPIIEKRLEDSLYGL